MLPPVVKHVLNNSAPVLAQIKLQNIRHSEKMLEKKVLCRNGSFKMPNLLGRGNYSGSFRIGIEHEPQKSANKSLIYIEQKDAVMHDSIEKTILDPLVLCHKA